MLSASKGKSVLAPTADFSKLPWNNGAEDINPDTAYISEAIVREPLDNANLFLTPGLHLHWTLPGALGSELPSNCFPHARNNPADPGQTGFPAAPNRWLVV